MVTMCGCQKKEQQETTTSSVDTIMSDTTLVLNILSGLDVVEGACWKESAMGGSSSIGPTDYSEIGYVKLTDTKAKEILDAYVWTEVMYQAEVDGLDTSAFVETNWMTNKDFTNDMLAKQYQGNLYFNGSVIWFDVITK